MSELNHRKCTNDTDFFGDLFSEDSDIRYFLSEDHKTFHCYTLDDIQGMLRSSVLYDWNGPEGSLWGANLDGQQYIKFDERKQKEAFIKYMLKCYDKYKKFSATTDMREQEEYKKNYEYYSDEELTALFNTTSCCSI